MRSVVDPVSKKHSSCSLNFHVNDFISLDRVRAVYASTSYFPRRRATAKLSVTSHVDSSRSLVVRRKNLKQILLYFESIVTMVILASAALCFNVAQPGGDINTSSLFVRSILDYDKQQPPIWAGFRNRISWC
jgi:hypothetical protein